MKKKYKALFLILPLALMFAGFSLPTSAAPTKHFDLYQNNSAGGAGCSGQFNCFNSTSPGPDINVNQGDLVSITVHNNDTIPHTFNITTTSTTFLDTGSMNGGTVKTLTTFTASVSGTYKCDIHPTDMVGSFKVKQVSSTPITPASLLALVGTTTVAAFITVRKRH